MFAYFTEPDEDMRIKALILEILTKMTPTVSFHTKSINSLPQELVTNFFLRKTVGVYH